MTDTQLTAQDSDHRPLRDQVRETIRAWIVSGKLEAGVRLRELDLANELSVSRVPVREAIRMLEVEGLISMSPRGGAVVTTLSLKDIHDLFDVREALEALVARLATERLTPPDERRIRGLLREVRFLNESGDHAGALQLNHSFHMEIAHVAGNPALASMLEPIGVRLRWHFSKDRDALKVLSEHEELFDAIAGGDADQAARLAARHVKETRKSVTSSFPKNERDSQQEGPA